MSKIRKEIAIGNGKNPRRVLNAARFGIAVSEGEGCAARALLNAGIQVRGVGERRDTPGPIEGNAGILDLSERVLRVFHIFRG
jgi:hypothetical protein